MKTNHAPYRHRIFTSDDLGDWPQQTTHLRPKKKGGMGGVLTVLVVLALLLIIVKNRSKLPGNEQNPAGWQSQTQAVQ